MPVQPAVVDWDSDGHQAACGFVRSTRAFSVKSTQCQTYGDSGCDCRLLAPAIQGDLDLLLLAGGRIHYFRNEHGRFVQAVIGFTSFRVTSMPSSEGSCSL